MSALHRANRGRIVAALAVAALFLAASAFAADPPSGGPQPVPPLRARVTDLTGTLSPGEQQALDAKLADWESRTSNQLAVLIVPTTAPETIEEYAIRVADAWKIGQKGKDNGAIFVIAKNDKRMRIEVGYGLEGVLPDITARRIIGDTVAPQFSKGQFAAGIDAGVDRIIGVVSGTEPAPTEQPRRRASSGHFDIGTLALILIFAVPLGGVLLRSIFGTVGGSFVGGSIIGAAVWFFVGSLIFAAIAGVIAFIMIAFSAFGGRGGVGGPWLPGGGGGGFGGGFGGGGGFSGGGGGFGGGGASGGWN